MTSEHVIIRQLTKDIIFDLQLNNFTLQGGGVWSFFLTQQL